MAVVDIKVVADFELEHAKVTVDSKRKVVFIAQRDDEELADCVEVSSAELLIIRDVMMKTLGLADALIDAASGVK